MSSTYSRFTARLLGSVALASLGVPVAVAGPAGSLTELESLALPGFNRAAGMSADGSTVVGMAFFYGGNSSAVSWSSTGAMTSLPVGPGDTSATAISADGSTIVGDFFIFGVDSGAFALRDGNVVFLPELSGITGNTPLAVSADGSIIVGYSQLTNTTGHAVTWSGANWATLTDLGTLVPGVSSSASGVDASGTLVAGWSDAADTLRHATYWQGGTIHDIGMVGFGSAGNAVSADGSTIVGVAGQVGLTQSRPTSWTGPGFTTQADLGSLGGDTGQAYAVSADGLVIVGSSAIAGNTIDHAFRYADGSMADLNTLLTAAGVDMTGIVLTDARGISAYGDYIATNDYSHGLSYLVFYDDGIGGITSKADQQASVDAQAKARQAIAIQTDAYAGILTGDLDRKDQSSDIGVFGLVGSLVGGAKGHAGLGDGWSLSGGIADASSVFGSATVGNSLMGAVALRYDSDLAFADFQPFGEVGGSFGLLSNISFARDYGGGVGVGITDGTLASLYARAGMTRDFDSGDQLSLAGELGGRWLATGAYSESFSATNPFPATIAAANDTQLVAKLSTAWTHPLSDAVDFTLRLAVGASLAGSSSLQVKTTGFGTLTSGIGQAAWAEVGGHLDWQVTDNSAVDLYATGIVGETVGTDFHAGAGYHFTF